VPTTMQSAAVEWRQVMEEDLVATRPKSPAMEMFVFRNIFVYINRKHSRRIVLLEHIIIMSSCLAAGLDFYFASYVHHPYLFIVDSVYYLTDWPVRRFAHFDILFPSISCNCFN